MIYKTMFNKKNKYKNFKNSNLLTVKNSHLTNKIILDMHQPLHHIPRMMWCMIIRHDVIYDVGILLLSVNSFSNFKIRDTIMYRYEYEKDKIIDIVIHFTG